jgi:endonuclease YncB( thermonuclease family)
MSGGHQKHSYLSAFVALCCSLALNVHAEVFSAKVIVVMDGDTIMVLRKRDSEAPSSAYSHGTRGGQKLKIRLAYIDAPEVGHAGMGGVPPNSQKDQPFGQQSRDSLLEMVDRKQVQIDSKAVDQYGRIVGVVSLDGLNINQEQVKRGLAWSANGWRKGRHAAPRPPKGRMSGEESVGKAYSRLQTEARQARRGLWSQDNPLAPWQWRKLHSSEKSTPQAN